MFHCTRIPVVNKKKLAHLHHVWVTPLLASSKSSKAFPEDVNF